MKDGTIKLVHGEGGKHSQELIRDMFYKNFNNPVLSGNDDSALLKLSSKEIAFTTDSFVVNPVFFRGGDIGKLAVSGTVNDLVSCGAEPVCLSLALIIEEGFPLSDLDKIAKSIKVACTLANVSIVAGDTKVVPKGKADGIFINTAGIGMVGRYEAKKVECGDKVIVTGTVGEHGTAIAVDRYGLKVEGNVESDCRPLNCLLKFIEKHHEHVKFMRDPTRGGMAQVLNEISMQCGLGVHLLERKIPIRGEVRAINDMLGINPLYLACEGRMVIVADKDASTEILESLKNDSGCEAAIIGEFTDETHFVFLENDFGGKAILGELDAQILPRIC